MPRYEVLYIDKFENTDRSHDVIENMDRLFKLTPTAQQYLTSGKPVVIKQHIDHENAVRFQRAILSAGGTAWIQEESALGHHVERRADDRRRLLSRRSVRRSSAIQPDRRKKPERREDCIH